MIPLNDTALKMVIDLRNEVYFGEDSPLIPDENGGVLSPRTFYSRYKRMVKACGLDKTGLHILRHTFATNLVKGQKEPDGRLKTLPVKIVAELLGHTTTCITERYYVRRDNVALKGITDDFNNNEDRYGMKRCGFAILDMIF